MGFLFYTFRKLLSLENVLNCFSLTIRNIHCKKQKQKYCPFKKDRDRDTHRFELQLPVVQNYNMKIKQVFPL